MEGMAQLAAEINAATRALDVPEPWRVKPKDDTSLSLEVEGECWGYRVLELRGDTYVAHDARGKERRWKLRSTAVDRLSKRIHMMYASRQQQRREAARVVEVQELLLRVEGLKQSLHQRNLFWVDHTDCRLWVYPHIISVESRGFGLHMSIPSGDGELDAVIESKVTTAVAAVSRIAAEVASARKLFNALGS